MCHLVPARTLAEAETEFLAQVSTTKYGKAGIRNLGSLTPNSHFKPLSPLVKHQIRPPMTGKGVQLLISDPRSFPRHCPLGKHGLSGPCPGPHFSPQTVRITPAFPRMVKTTVRMTWLELSRGNLSLNQAKPTLSSHQQAAQFRALWDRGEATALCRPLCCPPLPHAGEAQITSSTSVGSPSLPVFELLLPLK